MFTSFSTALSGLNAMTDAIDVVGNNLANLNTTGYKNDAVSFQEVISQALGGSASTQVGLGVARPTTTTQFSQGSIQTTAGQYDAAIQGEGFFVVKGGDGQQLFTRAGNFQVDQNGYLVTAGGERVQGWVADGNGVVSTNGALSDIQVPTGSILQPKPTSTFSLNANLDSSFTPVIPLSASGTTSGNVTITTGSNDTLNLGINGQASRAFTLSNTDTTVTAVATDLQHQFTAAGIQASATVDASSGALVVSSTSNNGSSGVQVYAGDANSTLGIGVTPTAANSGNTFSTTVVQAVDSLGNTIPLTLSFTKETTYGAWNYSVSAPEGTISGGTGTVQFDNTGKMVSLSGPAVTADGRGTNVTLSSLPDGAKDLNMTWSFFNTDGSPRFTQFSEASSASSNNQDGEQPAGLTSVSLGDNGAVLAKYSNGVQAQAAQLAIASIRNPQSLLGSPDNNFSLGADTAAPTIGAPGTGGRGTIQGGALESSTVDIASQFSSLLIFQRSYQANSRVITVSDELSQETVSLIK